MSTYAGIGSRETTHEILVMMEKIGYIYAAIGIHLNSGGARGADTAFELGCNSLCVDAHISRDSRSSIFLPKDGFNHRWTNTGSQYYDSLITDDNFTALNKYVFDHHSANLASYAKFLHLDINTPLHEFGTLRRAEDKKQILSKVYVYRLMARNCFQVLGKDLNTPVSQIVCWTRDGKESGGTGFALRLAKAFNHENSFREDFKPIQIINLRHPDMYKNVSEYIKLYEDRNGQINTTAAGYN